MTGQVPDARVREDEQAALRRVAALVARDVPPDEVFATVAGEIGAVAGVAVVSIMRYEPDGRATQLGVFGQDPLALGTTWSLDGPSVVAAVRATARPARMDDYAHAPGTLAAASREAGVTSGVGVPIVIAGQVWGVVVALSTDEAPLPPDTERRLAGFTELVAAAVTNAQARADLRRLADEQSALRRVATLVARGAAPADVFATVAAEVARVVDVALASIIRVGADGLATQVGAWGAANPFPIGTAWPLDETGVTARVARTGHAARVDDYGDVPGPIAARLSRDAGIRTAVGVPIVVDGRTWGAMMVLSTRETPLPEATETRLERFTELVATAIGNAQARGELRQLVDEQAALRRIATLVARGAAPADVFGAVAATVAELLPAPRVSVFRCEDDGTAERVGGAGLPGPYPVGSRVPPHAGVIAMVVASGRPARVDDYGAVPGAVAAALRASELAAAVGAPIVVDGGVWGVVVAMATAGETLPEGTESRLESFTELLATAISNTQARDDLRALADEQAALRRVATLVAEGTASSGVFDSICEEAGRLLGSTSVGLCRFTPDRVNLTVAGWSLRDTHVPVGTRLPIEGGTINELLLRHGTPQRVDDYGRAEGALAEVIRGRGIRSEVGAPVVVEGGVWGALILGFDTDEPPPAGMEHAVARFSALVATAISNAQNRTAVDELAREQAALRRVATLVATRAAPADVFAAVVEEVGHVLAAEVTDLWRYDEEGAAVFVASWTSGPPLAFPERLALDGVSVGRLVRDTGRPARIDDYDAAHAREPGTVTRTWGELGISAAIGCPVVVAGRTWGVMSACRLRGAPLPAGAEERLASFTELVGTAIANATTYASLIASRARLVAAGDEARRRIERDLHDGTQQQLVSIGLDVQSLKLSLPADLAWAHAELDRIRGSLDSAVDEVREISRGLHPAILSQAGLGAALRTLARRSAVPATVDARLDAALPESVEIALYFVVAEALANAAKHAGATTVEIAVATTGERLTAAIRDDGRGGAAVASGSGLAGIADRVEALGGTLRLTSPPGAGTAVEIELPLALLPTADA